MGETPQKMQAVVTLSLLTNNDPYPQRKFKVQAGKELLIGRSSLHKVHTERPPPNHDNAFFDCPVISRKHAIFTLNSAGVLYVTDTDSRHGTLVGSYKLKAGEKRSLVNGEVLHIGGNVFAEHRLYPARKFVLNYYVESYREPSSSSCPSVNQSTTFVVPDSSDESNDSDQDVLEIDDEELQVVDIDSCSSPDMVELGSTERQTQGSQSKAASKAEDKGPAQSVEVIELDFEECQPVPSQTEDPTHASKHVIDLEEESVMEDEDENENENEDDSEDEDEEEEYEPEPVPCKENDDTANKSHHDSRATKPAMCQVTSPSVSDLTGCQTNGCTYDLPLTKEQPTDIWTFDKSRLFSRSVLNKGYGDYAASTRADDGVSEPSEDHGVRPTLFEDVDSSVAPNPPDYHSFFPVNGISIDPYERRERHAVPFHDCEGYSNRNFIPPSPYCPPILPNIYPALPKSHVCKSGHERAENMKIDKLLNAMPGKDTTQVLKRKHNELDAMDSLPAPPAPAFTPADAQSSTAIIECSKAVCPSQLVVTQNETNSSEPHSSNDRTSPERPLQSSPECAPVSEKSPATSSASESVLSSHTKGLDAPSVDTDCGREDNSEIQAIADPKSKNLAATPSTSEPSAKRIRLSTSAIPQSRPHVRSKTSFIAPFLLGAVVGGLGLFEALVHLPESYF